MIRPIFIHCRPDAGYDLRFDTLMMVNMGVAALNQVAFDLLGYPSVAIDETFMGSGIKPEYERNYLLELVSNLCEEYQVAGEEPVVLCTLLQYNAMGSHYFLKELKQRFGGRIRVGVGGQHVTLCEEARQAWLNKPWIDVVAAGDAEILLQGVFAGERAPVGKKAVLPLDHYAPPLYEGYVGLTERLEEMSKLSLRGITGMRMLLTESIRGCSYAHAIKRACVYCAEDVLRPLQFRNVQEHLAIEQELHEQYGTNWVFDVSNQWLPVQGREEQARWLHKYLAAKEQFGGSPINRYAYLTANSFSPETAPLLRQAGIAMAYIGIDGWDKVTRQAQHTAQTDPFQVLEAAKQAGILVRTSLVIGTGITQDNICELPQFVRSVLSQYGDTVLSFGTFTEIVLPGAENWRVFRKMCRNESSLREACEIYQRFDRDGFMSLEDQEYLNFLRIQHTQPVPLEMILAAKEEAQRIIEESATLSVDIRRCDHIEQVLPPHQ